MADGRRVADRHRGSLAGAAEAGLDAVGQDRGAARVADGELADVAVRREPTEEDVDGVVTAVAVGDLEGDRVADLAGADRRAADRVVLDRAARAHRAPRFPRPSPRSRRRRATRRPRCGPTRGAATTAGCRTGRRTGGPLLRPTGGQQYRYGASFSTPQVSMRSMRSAVRNAARRIAVGTPSVTSTGMVTAGRTRTPLRSRAWRISHSYAAQRSRPAAYSGRSR